MTAPFDPDNDVPDNIEGGPYRPTDADFAPTPRPKPGPLERRPGTGDFLRILRFYMLVVIASVLYWRGEVPSFPVSRHAVFENGEYWRLFSALFIHADVGHLISNTPLLIIFGWFLRFHFGWLAFPIIALLLGAASNLVTIYFYPPMAQLVGASGMIYAMVGLWLVWYIRYDYNRPLTVRIVRAVAFSLVVMFPTTFHETTSYLAHAAGFVLGMVTALLSMQLVKVNKPNN